MAIDLSESNDYPSPISMSEMSKEKHYPGLHISCDEDIDLPDEGEMTVTFKRRNATERTDKDGNCTYTYDLDICSIESVDGKELEDDAEEAGGKSYDDASSALDKIAEALGKKS
jgi:hypothetical protein